MGLETTRGTFGVSCKDCGAIGPHNCTDTDEAIAKEVQEAMDSIPRRIIINSVTPEQYASTIFGTSVVDTTLNNGGDTDYYKIDTNWKMAQDIIEDRGMNYSQGNIFKVAFTFNQGRHEAAGYERELNKIIYFAQRELETLKGK